MSRPVPPIERRSAVLFVAFVAFPILLAAMAAPVRAQTLRNDLWVTDGVVTSEAVSGNTLYIGGNFAHVGPPTGGWVPVDSLGRLAPASPLVCGNVYCSAADGKGGWFLGGDFNGAGGQARTNLAHIDASGNLYPWNPTANDPVRAMLLFAGRLYVGGGFTNVDGQTRNHLAVVDTASGNVGTWQPILDGDVYALTSFGSTFLVGGAFSHVSGFVRHYFAGIDTAGALWSLDPEPNSTVDAIGVVHRLVPNTVTVYLGGYFTAVGGQSRASLAAIDATTGSATFGQALAFNPNPGGVVRALLVTGGTLTPTIYVGGSFSQLGGQPRSNLGAINASGTATTWNPGVDSNGEVLALGLQGTTLFAGGQFTTLGGDTRINAGAVDTGTGVVSLWNPSPNGVVTMFSIGAQSIALGGLMSSIGGVVRYNLAALDLTSGGATAWNPNVNGVVHCLQVVGGHLYAGGTFGLVGGVPRSNIAQIDLATAEPGPWAPSPNNEVDCIAGRALGNGHSMIYFGGQFGTVSSLPRNYLAAMSDDPAAPGLDAWNPSASWVVDALAVSGNTIYAGGGFTQIGTNAAMRSALAALDTTGAATAWNPGLYDGVNALATFGSVVYATGRYPYHGGTAQYGVAAIDAVSGSVQPWPVYVNNAVLALAATPGAIYAEGVFDSVGTSYRKNLAAIDPSTGNALDWNAATFSPLTQLIAFPFAALVEQGGVLYVSGEFSGILNSPHSNVAGIYAATTGVDPRHIPSANAGRATIQAFPNPFRGGVAFGVNLPRAGTLKVGVYAVDGRLVRDLSPTIVSAGAQRIDWDGRDAAGRMAPAGVYLVRARSGGWEANGRVVRLR